MIEVPFAILLMSLLGSSSVDHATEAMSDALQLSRRDRGLYYTYTLMFRFEAGYIFTFFAAHPALDNLEPEETLERLTGAERAGRTEDVLGVLTRDVVLDLFDGVDLYDLEIDPRTVGEFDEEADIDHVWAMVRLTLVDNPQPGGVTEHLPRSVFLRQVLKRYLVSSRALFRKDPGFIWRIIGIEGREMDDSPFLSGDQRATVESSALLGVPENLELDAWWKLRYEAIVAQPRGLS